MDCRRRLVACDRFVVPVLAVEDVGVGTALRRSTATIRLTWGESVTGAIAIGGVLAVSGLVLIGVAAVGLAIGSTGCVAGYVLTAVCAVAAAVILLVENAMCQIFRLAVYRYATGDGSTGPFAADDLAAAFKPRSEFRR